MLIIKITDYDVQASHRDTVTSKKEKDYKWKNRATTWIVATPIAILCGVVNFSIRDATKAKV